jgi:adhesin transport system outer membrane protein
MSRLHFFLAFSALSLVVAPAGAQSKASKARAAKPVEASASAPVTESRQSRCGEEDGLPARAGNRDGTQFEISNADPRIQLQELVQLARQRSQGLGAATLLAQAARAEWEEARAARLPQVNLGGTLAHAGNKVDGFTLQSGVQASANLSVSAPIYDSGRNLQLANWRAQLAESSRYGLISVDQQLALQTVSLAMDRSRYQLQAQVYGQYVRKMHCLVEALEIIVKADRGRASELVQAEKNQQQAELAVAQTLSTLRQVEGRLRRFVGEQLPPSASYTALLTQVPDLAEMQRDAEQAPELAQLEAQARAQSSYAESVAAGYKPQVSLLLGGTATAAPGVNGGTNKSGEWVAGVSVNIPIYNAGADHGIEAARKRADAARLQRDDQLESRRYRMVDMHEAAVSSFDRARRIVDILRNSERVRASTLQQWQQLGRRSLFDVMGAEADYYSMRVAQVNALVDGQQAVALLWSLGRGVMMPLQ